ncbi:MAG TPA: HDIG domain-containing protein [Smithella sp.]|nr:HDIG domain-containing protein [Smithella sp.]
MDAITLSNVVVFFAVYSFFGWIIEVIYRSASQRRFINAGFLYGPFVPIYGFGATFVILIDYLLDFCPFPVKVLLFGLILTMVEYLTSYILEKTFQLKLWDYSNNKFNLHGRVCLLFSFFWTALAVVFVTLIHPAVSRFVQVIPTSFLNSFSVAFLAYGITDAVFSVISMASFRRKISDLYAEYLNLNNTEIEKIFSPFKRLRNAFPNLGQYIDYNINAEIKNKIGSFLKSIPEKFIPVKDSPKPLEKEFYQIIADIYEHEEFVKLKNHYHHNSSIYEHVMDVAYLSYRACKLLNLDYRAATRGALLHDFFLYDWRNHSEPDLPEHKNHGIEHPKIALANAQKHFELEEIEKDIIIKHMWPLTVVPPKYKESYVVSFVDKYLASKEFMKKYNSKVSKRIKRPAAGTSLRKKRKAKTSRHKK